MIDSKEIKLQFFQKGFNYNALSFVTKKNMLKTQFAQKYPSMMKLLKSVFSTYNRNLFENKSKL